MKPTLRLCSPILFSLLAGCSSSNDEATSTPQDFIGVDEQSGAKQNSGNQGSNGASPVDLYVPEREENGSIDGVIDGSGVVVAEEGNAAWAIPDEGASFTGPPLQAGEGPDNADVCLDQELVTTATEGVGESICFFSEEDPETPAARIDQVIESVEGQDFVRIRLTLNPNFVDNTYGETAVGWGGDEAEAEAVVEEAPEAAEDPMAAEDGMMMPEDGMMPGMMKPGMTDGMMKPPKPGKGGHTFNDLVGSDHAEIMLTDSKGDVVLHVKVDYLSEDPDAPSGYSSLGVLGGEGAVLEGEAEWVLQATSSMDRNFNACGYGEYTEDSPTPPTPDEAGEAENWDYRVVYEMWVSLDAFGDEDFGEAFIEFVHASPSKGSDNTVDVTAGPCPPDEDPPITTGSGGAPSTEPPDAGSPGGSGGAPSTPTTTVEQAR